MLAGRKESGYNKAMVDADDLTAKARDELAFTREELAELEKARERPISFDEDCPETTPERAVKFRRANPPRAKASDPG